jgi:acetylornithine aminotransferase
VDAFDHLGAVAPALDRGKACLMTTRTAVEPAAPTKLAAEYLQADPRIAEAKRLITSAIDEHRRRITEIRPPDPERAAAYQKLLEEFGQLRGGNLYFPFLGSGIGNGALVELADGSVKLDMITGIGVHGYGHSDPRLIAAGIDAALADTVMQGNLQQNIESVRLVRLLLELANESGAELSHCFLTSSGAMANENALKIVFQKHSPASRVLAFEHCFAGRTLALAQVTDKAAYRDGLPKVLDVDFIPFFDEADPQGSTRRALQALRAHVGRYPRQHACLWMELVQGEGGYYAGDRDFFLALIAEARKHDMAIVVDEIQTFARLSRPFAFQHYQLDSHVDVVTVGKITQACATLYRSSYRPRPGLISQTFTASTFSIVAGERILRGLVEGGHFGADGRNQRLHRRFVDGLQRIAEKFPAAVRGPFGVGGMVVFTPFNGSADKAKEMVFRMYEAGLMSFMAGSNPARIRFLMPLGSVTEEQIDQACDIIEHVAAEMIAGA